MLLLFMTGDFSKDPDREKNLILEKSLKKIAKGNMEAVADIYEIARTPIYGYVLAILKNPDEAEDVTQDTFVKICTGAEQYRPQGKPMAWILTIARNLALMKIRGQKRYGELEEYEWEQIPDRNAAFKSDDRIVLQAALSKISEEESRIIMLHVVSGLKHREIAQMMDMPLATVLSKYNRAIKKLQKILEEA